MNCRSCPGRVDTDGHNSSYECTVGKEGREMCLGCDQRLQRLFNHWYGLRLAEAELF